MGYFEVDTNVDELLTVDSVTIDVQRLIDRIQERYYKLRERSSDDGFLCVITLEEWRACQYFTKTYPSYNQIRIPIYRHLLKNGLKSAPYLGMMVFGLQLIGSDLIGEMSPLIL